MTIPIYTHEKNLNLDEIIATANTVTLACNKNTMFAPNTAKADTLYSEEEYNLHKQYVPKGILAVNSILVTTNWNRNDDVFSPDEVWKARTTPLYKPANVNHEGRESTENKIIGVISYSQVVDDEYKMLNIVESSEDEDEDEELDDKLPTNFHILITTFLWEPYFPTAVGEIIEKINSGNMYVSMECQFNDFGYALQKEGTDQVSLLPRTEATAYMTPYLRAYKGKGIININGSTYRIGRWLKNIVFSGVGFVDQPANPESIVFEDIISAKKVNFEKIEEILSSNDKDRVLNNDNQKISLWLN